MTDEEQTMPSEEVMAMERKAAWDALRDGFNAETAPPLILEYATWVLLPLHDRDPATRGKWCQKWGIRQAFCSNCENHPDFAMLIKSMSESSVYTPYVKRLLEETVAMRALHPDARTSDVELALSQAGILKAKKVASEGVDEFDPTGWGLEDIEKALNELQAPQRSRVINVSEKEPQALLAPRRAESENPDG